MTSASRPSLPLDLYGTAELGDPDGTYRLVRDTGPAVWLPRNRLWAIGRYRDVKTALRAADVFTSGSGVAANPFANRLGSHTVLASDGDVHGRRRGVMLDYLAARKVAALEETLVERADRVVDDLQRRGRFDAVADFGAALPVGVVADLVGLRQSGERMLSWAAGTFDALGGVNSRSLRAGGRGLSLKAFGLRLRPQHVAPDSWAAGIFAAADRGDISRAEARAMVIDFTAPSLDTTILASAHMLKLLADRPELWEAVRSDAGLVAPLVAEAVRISSPIRGFTRRVAVDTEVDGQPLRAGRRVALLFAAANSDERQFVEPDAVDLTRPVNQQLGWGHGPHACVGMHLAKLEMAALVEAMRNRVRTVRIDGRGTRLVNNTLQGYASLPASFG
ncbi:cytochrome P450 family protein [Jatrophihabitans fulvus]